MQGGRSSRRSRVCPERKQELGCTPIAAVYPSSRRMICRFAPAAIREAPHALKASPAGRLRPNSPAHRSESDRRCAALLPYSVARCRSRPCHVIARRPQRQSSDPCACSRRALIISTTAAVPSAVGDLFGARRSARSLVRSGADKFLQVSPSHDEWPLLQNSSAECRD